MNLSELIPRGGVQESKNPTIQSDKTDPHLATRVVTHPIKDPGLIQVKIKAISAGMKFEAIYGPNVTPLQAREHLLSLDPKTEFETSFYRSRGSRTIETANAITATLERTKTGKLFLAVTFQSGDTSGVAKGFYDNKDDAIKVISGVPIIESQLLPVIEGNIKSNVALIANIAKVKYYKGKEKGDYLIDSLESIPENGAGNSNNGGEDK